MPVKLYVENRQVVVPGDVIAEGDVEASSPYLERVGQKLYSTILGLVMVSKDQKKTSINIIPLEGPYIPKPGDIVIGIVTDYGLTHWEVDIRAPYRAILTVQEVLDHPFNPAVDDLRRYLDVGDYVLAKVAAFDRTRDPLLTIKGSSKARRPLGRIGEGEGLVVEVKPSRIPRIIGKRASMINMLMEETKCDIIVGQNGRILIKCPSKELEEIAVLAIKMIEREAHTTGLTERVKELIRREREKRGV